MQRPDADHVEFDPTRTSLDGLGASANISKLGGGHWRYWTGFRVRTPEYESNDIGYMSRTDFFVVWGGVGYAHDVPTRRFRRWNLSSNNWRWGTYGGEPGSVGSRLSIDVQFLNYWNVRAATSYSIGGLSVGMLRGGPAVESEDSIDTHADVSSDGRRRIQFRAAFDHNRQRESDSWSYNVSPNLGWRPAGRAQMNIGAFYNISENDRQWVTRFRKATDYYVFGRIARQTVGLTGRLDFALTQNLSLQLYAQPFVSAGRYEDFKTMAAPRAARYVDRFAPLGVNPVEGGYEFDVDADGETEFIANPDFNFKQFRSNAVLRWEYLPGSTFFAVWSQGRQLSSPTGELELGSDLSDLFEAPVENVVMVKLSHWLSPIGGF